MSEKNVQEVSQKEKKKINFFKKMAYSIGRVSKYDEMIDLGPKEAIKYFFGLLSFISAMLGIAAICIGISSAVDIEFNNIVVTIIMNFLIYFISHFIIFFLIFSLYILIISACFFAIIKLIIKNNKFRNSLSMTIYATTLSIIVYAIYLIISYLVNFVIPHFDMIAVLIEYIYLWLIIRRKRKEWGDEFYRRSKKKSKK